MQKKVILLGFILGGASLPAQALFNPNNNLANSGGIYLGGQLGMSNLHYRGSAYTSAHSSYDKHNLPAGRVYLGYGFTPFFSAELGYNYYGHPRFKYSTQQEGTTQKQKLIQHGLDLSVKAHLPLDYGFSFYAKAGLALVHRGSLNSYQNQFVQKDANNKIAPLGSLGVNYWFAPHMAVDFSWTKTMKVGDLPTSDLVTIGLLYKLTVI